ncbi:MAG: hypothetical protein ABEI06_09805 [Halobacteriaceae archaeon]
MKRRALLSSFAVIFAGCGGSENGTPTTTPSRTTKQTVTPTATRSQKTETPTITTTDGSPSTTNGIPSGLIQPHRDLLLLPEDLKDDWELADSSTTWARIEKENLESRVFWNIYSGYIVYDSVAKAKDEFERRPVIGGDIGLQKVDIGDEAIMYHPTEDEIDVTFRIENALGLMQYEKTRTEEAPKEKEALKYATAMVADWPTK